MGLWDDIWSGAGEIVDRGAGTVVGAGTVLGGITLVVGSEGVKLLNDAAFGLDFKTEEEHELTEEYLDQTQEFGKGVAAGGAVQVVKVFTEPVDLDERQESSDGFWDLFFQDTADGIGTSLTAGTILADIERTDEIPSEDEILDRRETVAGWEDEILATVFVGVPIAMFPALRLLLAAATPVAFSAVSNAIQTGSGIANDILQTFLIALDLATDGDEEEGNDDSDSDDDEDDSEPESTDPSEDEEIVPDETEENTVRVVEEVVAKPFFASMGLDESNKFKDREIIY
jgi:hypothetical protein